jgi:hypothetical protein
MMEPFQVAGLALVVAAIVGGGLEAAGFKIGVVESLMRQLMLGGLGVVLFIAGTPEVWSWVRPAPPPPIMSSVGSTPPQLLTATSLPSPTVAVSTSTPTSTPAPLSTPTSEPSATSTAAPAATEAPAPAATSAPAPAPRTPVLPGIRKDAPDRRP